MKFTDLNCVNALFSLNMSAKYEFSGDPWGGAAISAGAGIQKL
jgi:hypothetical protein